MILIKLKFHRRNEVLRWVYFTLSILSFGAILGGRHSTKPMLRFFDAPGWLYWFFGILLVLSIIFLIRSFFSTSWKVGSVIIDRVNIKIEHKREKEIYVLDQVEDLTIKIKWSSPKLLDDHQHGVLHFIANGESHQYDILRIRPINPYFNSE